MIDRTHPLSITRQAQVVGISRGAVYYRDEPVSDADLKLMRRVDELHLELPFAGARMLRDLLRAEGLRVGRKHITALTGAWGPAATRSGLTSVPRHSPPPTTDKSSGPP